VPTYLVERYWPGVTIERLLEVLERGRRVMEQMSGEGTCLHILVPKAYGVTPGSPVTFGTIAVKTTSRGFIDTPGTELTYDVLPLVAQAHQVIEPA
jgi:hypothetical protein